MCTTVNMTGTSSSTPRNPTKSDANQLSKDVLMQFTGSENWYRHALNRAVLFTNRAKHVADAGGAYWLLDEIALAQRYEKAMTAEDFQCWRLTVNPDSTGILTCEDGNGHARFRGFSGRGRHSQVCQQHDLSAQLALTEDRAGARSSPHSSGAPPRWRLSNSMPSAVSRVSRPSNSRAEWCS